MKAKSAHEKGRRFERYLVGVFRESVDANTQWNRKSGAGLDKGDIRIPSRGLLVEAKNSARVNLLEDWEQAKGQCTGDDRPVLALRNPRRSEFEETLVVVDLGTFLELLERSTGTSAVRLVLDGGDRYKIRQLAELLRWFEKKYGGVDNGY